MEEAKAAILAIVDPPKAELGKVYNGRVVNITKFGAFVNILPGRDGLVHISKLGRGKRINAVEDVLTLGQEIEVRVDEIDDKGKVSLSPVGDGPRSPHGAPARPVPAAVGAAAAAPTVERRASSTSRSRSRSTPSSPTSSATSVRRATGRRRPVHGRQWRRDRGGDRDRGRRRHRWSSPTHR